MSAVDFVLPYCRFMATTDIENDYKNNELFSTYISWKNANLYFNTVATKPLALCESYCMQGIMGL